MRVPSSLAGRVRRPAGRPRLEDLDAAFVRVGPRGRGDPPTSGDGHRPARGRPGAGHRGADRVQEADPVLPGRRRRGGAAGHRLRRAQLRRRRHGRGRAARRGAARRLRDRRAHDLRPRLRRDDLLGPRARASATTTPGSWCCRGRRPAARARRRRAGRWSASTTSSSSSRSPRTAATACPCAASPASWRTRSASRSATRRLAVPPLDGQPAGRSTSPTRRAATGSRCVAVERPRPGRADPVVDPPPAGAGRRPDDLAGRRRHQLRDARARPADARLRPRRRLPGRSPCAGPRPASS